MANQGIGLTLEDQVYEMRECIYKFLKGFGGLQKWFSEVPLADYYKPGFFALEEGSEELQAQAQKQSWGKKVGVAG